MLKYNVEKGDPAKPVYKIRKNCFRYLKLMSPLNAAICTTISYT
jgi:hypothetical protein